MLEVPESGEEERTFLFVYVGSMKEAVVREQLVDPILPMIL